MKAFGVRDLAEFAARLADLRASLAPPSEPGDYTAYTDGACFGNPEGPGGWAAIVLQDTATWRLFGHLSSTSNNRAEALGVLAALEWAPAKSRLRLHSDSELTVRQLQGRYKIKSNLDIWGEIQRLRADKQLDVVPEWVRGHAGDPLNELADRLSKLGADNRLTEDAALDAAVAETPRPRADTSELDGLHPRGDWERDFLRSLRDQLRRGRTLSDKQRAILDRMRQRG